MSPDKRSPDEAKLDCFVGDWVNTGSVSPASFGPGGPVTGETSYHWDLGNRWLLYTSQLELPGLGAYEVRGGVAWNPNANRYDAYAINNVGSLLVYEGKWTDDTTLVFTLVHPQPGNAQVTYQRQPDGAIVMTSARASTDGSFEPYFVTDMARL